MSVCTGLSRTGISRGTATAVLNRCRDIQRWVTDNLSLLTDYKVTQADVTTLKNRIKALEEVRQSRVRPRPWAGAATRRLEVQFARLDELLARQLDKLAVKFKQSVPEFYEAHKASRSTRNRYALPGFGLRHFSRNAFTLAGSC